MKKSGKYHGGERTSNFACLKKRTSVASSAHLSELLAVPWLGCRVTPASFWLYELCRNVSSSLLSKESTALSFSPLSESRHIAAQPLLWCLVHQRRSSKPHYADSLHQAFF